jgi:hypothetical protein
LSTDSNLYERTPDCIFSQFVKIVAATADCVTNQAVRLIGNKYSTVVAQYQSAKDAALVARARRAPF